MNERRRQKLRDADSHLGAAFNLISAVAVEEDMTLRNVPYNLQYSDSYSDREDILEQIEEVLEHVNDAREKLEEVV